MVGGLAVCTLSAHVGVWLAARVLALEAHTSFTGVAVSVTSTLCVASGVWVTKEILGTSAGSAVVTCLKYKNDVLHWETKSFKIGLGDLKLTKSTQSIVFE